MIFLNVYFFYIFIREKQADTRVNVVHLSSQAPPTAGVSQHYAGQKTILTETGDRNKLWMFLLRLEKKPTNQCAGRQIQVHDRLLPKRGEHGIP